MMCQFGGMNAGHLPIFLALLMSIALGVTYVLAVHRDDVDPLFPYISAAGTKGPESCIFSLFVNFCAFLSATIIYLRYRLVKELNRDADRCLTTTNLIGCLLGFVSIFGLTLVANFQESALITVHLSGAFTCFGCGILYSLFQTLITYRMFPLYTGIRICRIRLLITILSFAAFVTSIVTGNIATHKYHLIYPDKPTPRPWPRNHSHEPGYPLHVASAVSEWFLVILFTIFLVSYSRDFEKLRVRVSAEPLVLHLDESPVVSPQNSLSDQLIIT